jgi:hypothetical protein
MFSFGYFPGVRLSFADVSEPSVRSIVKGLMKMDLAEGSETSAKLNLTPGKYPKENIQVSEHGENLNSRMFKMFLRVLCTVIIRCSETF